MPERLRFLAGDGETAVLLRAYAWSVSPLGTPGTWSGPLKTLVGVMLAANQPMFIVWGPSRTFLYNDAYATILADKHPAAMGCDFLDVWAEIRTNLAPLVEQAYAGLPAHMDDITLVMQRRGYPEETHFAFSYTPVRDETSAVAGFFCPCVETTARVLAERRLRETEKALRESEARWYGLFNAAPFSIIVLDPESHRILDVNEYACQAYGYSREEFTALSIAAIDALGDSDAIRSRGRSGVIRPGTQEFEARHRTRNGELRDVLVRVTGVRLDGRDVTYGAHFDITDRKAIEAALRASEARWRGLFEGMQEGILLAEVVRDGAGRGVDWRFLAMNPAWEKVTGWSRDATVGRTLLEVLPTVEPAWVDTFVQVAETGEPTNFERGVALLGKWYSVHAFRTEPDRFAALFLDITERRAADERQALLTREVDHRAKNALSVALAAVRLTRAPDMKNYVKAVEGRVTALARAHTILAQDRWAGADLETLLQGELMPFLGEAPGEPQARLRGSPVSLPANAAQPLAMAFHELATNAVKYGALSVPDGRLTVTWSVDWAQPPVLQLRWIEKGSPTLSGTPARKGFGSRVLEATIQTQLGGTVSLAWEPSGLVCEVEVPLRREDPEARRDA